MSFSLLDDWISKAGAKPVTVLARQAIAKIYQNFMHGDVQEGNRLVSKHFEPNANVNVPIVYNHLNPIVHLKGDCMEHKRLIHQMLVGKVEIQSDRILIFEERDENDPWDYYAIAQTTDVVKVGDQIEYEPAGANFGWFVKVVKSAEEPKANASH